MRAARATTRQGLLVVLLAALCLPTAARATETSEQIDFEKLKRERQARAGLYPVRARISRYLGAAAEAVDEGDLDEAKRLLARLGPGRLNPYERALVYRLEAYVDYTAGNYDLAIESFRKVLGEAILPLRDDNRIRFNIAQLYAARQEWRNVIESIHEWMRYSEEPTPLSHYLLGISYYQLDEVDSAIAETEKAIDLSPSPPEGWLQLLAALFVQKEDYASAAPVLEELLIRYPKKPYWVQLSLIYGARDNHSHSLAVQQFAYLQGMLTEEKELLRLARSYLFQNLPYPAARVIEEGLENGTIEPDVEVFELLANSWISAREYDRSLEPLHKAAELSEDGNLHLRLGQVYMQREEWKRAVTMLREALQRGGLKDPGNAQLLLGICYYNDARIAQARTQFSRARKFDSTRAAADQWITHIEREAGAG